VLADPIQLNSRLGTYTNFVNLLDLCGLALPAFMTERAGSGRHHAAGAGRDDARLAEIGRVFHADTKLPMGALKLPQPPLTQATNAPASGEIAVAVVGAHLSGLPLNGELSSLGGRLLEATKTAPDYRLYALNGTIPPKPGLLRVDSGKGAPSRWKSGRCRWTPSAVRRRHSVAAVDRHAEFVGWSRGHYFAQRLDVIAHARGTFRRLNEHRAEWPARSRCFSSR